MDPNQTEVAARGAKGIIAFVEDRDTSAASEETVGKRQADHAAANDGILAVHEIAATFASKVTERQATPCEDIVKALGH